MQNAMTQYSSQGAVSIEDEAQTVADARKDPRAFGELYDRYAPRIYRYLLSRLGSVEDARDITSQTFLTAYQTFPRYKHKGYFSAWLFSIARSKYVDHWRKAQSRIETHEEQDPEPLPDPLLQVIEIERVAQLKQQIRELTDHEQELLRLRFVAELSFSEIASVLNKKEDTVKKSLYRLLARLQSQMEK
jgi:RNA polymerase sigma-70 factor (ECF subfamily)